MNENVQFIKVSTQILGSSSFRFFINNKRFRDNYEAVWFELLVLAGQVNNDGFFFNDDVDYDIKEIAILLDRNPKQLDNCITAYTKYKMVERVNGKLCITNWMKYQKAEGLEKIREQNRERQRKKRERQKEVVLSRDSNVTCNVTVTQSSRATRVSEELRNKNEYMNKRINEYIISSHTDSPFVKYLFGAGFLTPEDEMDFPYYDAICKQLLTKYEFTDLTNATSRFCKYAQDQVITNKLKYFESSIKYGLEHLELCRESSEEYEKELEEYMHGNNGTNI